jgi:hypothetical protein
MIEIRKGTLTNEDTVKQLIDLSVSIKDFHLIIYN